MKETVAKINGWNIIMYKYVSTKNKTKDVNTYPNNPGNKISYSEEN